MNKLDLSQPKRQSPVGMVVIFFKNLRIGINIFVSLFFVQYGFRIDPSSNWLWIAVFSLLGIFAVLSVLQYRKFYFYVSGNQMIIEKGVISREKITIPFDRIQSVHINQNIVQQFLNVVAVKIDTAGSAVKEMEIYALERTYARRVQEFLMRMKAQNQEEGEEAQLTEDGDLDIGGEATPLVKLSLGEVFRVGLTENHLRTGLVLFAVIFGYVWQFEEYLRSFEPYLETQKDFVANRWLQMLPIAMALFLVIAVLLSLIQSFLKYYGLRFFIDKRGAQLISGLLKKVEYQIPLHKIQFIKWSSNPL
ncbi:MAG: PH domain-containing protein, partial [Owenweeksia sp.]